MRVARVLIGAAALIAFAAFQVGLAGEGFFIDRELAAAVPGQGGSVICPVGGDPDSNTFFLIANGQVWPYYWTPTLIERGDPFGTGIARAVPLPSEAGGRGLLLLPQNGQDYQIWRQEAGEWAPSGQGTFGGRVVAAAAGRFAAGMGAGLFAQLDSGKIGYWQVDRNGLLPLWQSPDTWQPYAHPEDILSQVPETEDRYIVVPDIPHQKLD